MLPGVWTAFSPPHLEEMRPSGAPGLEIYGREGRKDATGFAVDTATLLG